MVDTDVLIIGAGPAGAAAATHLARRGLDVRVFEKQRFPRFSVGESLLPCSTPLLERLGVTQELDAHFLKKWASEFVTSDGELRRRYTFDDGLIPHVASAWQVERSKFDQLLADTAAAAGAHIEHGVTVHDVHVGDDGARAKLRRGGGAVEEVRARFVVDASGRQSPVAARYGKRRMDKSLKNVSLFRHYAGALRGQGKEEGDISLVIAPDSWWWVIPMAGNLTSVGWVAPQGRLGGAKMDESSFERLIADTPEVARRLTRAEPRSEVIRLSDFSYSCARVVGPRWVLVGDSAAFLDPIFSTGVHFALAAAEQAADVVESALGAGGKRAAKRYARWLGNVLDVYRRFVYGFYRREFVELLFYPTDRLDLRRAVTSLLAGVGTEEPELSFRIATFLTLTRINRHVALVPSVPAWTRR